MAQSENQERGSDLVAVLYEGGSLVVSEKANEGAYAPGARPPWGGGPSRGPFVAQRQAAGAGDGGGRSGDSGRREGEALKDRSPNRQTPTRAHARRLPASRGSAMSLHAAGARWVRRHTLHLQYSRCRGEHRSAKEPRDAPHLQALRSQWGFSSAVLQRHAVLQWMTAGLDTYPGRTPLAISVLRVVQGART